MIKTEAREIVEALLASAKSRGTNQGVVIYEKAIEMLEGSVTESEARDVVAKLNRALAGIEAHGDFTDGEYECVKRLRELA